MHRRGLNIAYKLNYVFCGMIFRSTGISIELKFCLCEVNCIHVIMFYSRFEVNFGQRSPWFPPPPGFTFIDNVPLDQRVRGMMGPLKKADCEVG